MGSGVSRSVAQMERTELIEALHRLGTPPRMMQHLPDLAQVEGLLIYGSRARGDSVPGSDLDLLAVVETARPSWSAGDVSVSYYTRAQLATGIGTLFGAHLKRDAIVLWEGDGGILAALDALGDVDTERLLRRARDMSQLFTTPGEDLPRYLPGLLREARYLLRSCLYAQAILDDRPCFSVRELAVRHGDPELASLLSSRQAVKPSTDHLNRCLERLDSIIGKFPPSRNGSLEATIVNEWGQPGDLLSMAFLALGVTGEGSDYAEVEKILL